MPLYCASSAASIALRAERFGHTIHGHDVEVTLCINSTSILNLDRLSSVIGDIVSTYDHRPLWDVIPGDPLLEHMACRILEEASSLLGVEKSRMSIEVRILGAKIIVFGGEDICSRLDNESMVEKE